ncbi:MAG: DUF2911 domain-containing protein [Chitinophagaceae bacterium]|nr:DUF2911 domain-containing protein [Chitinophagaceae bacterium]
MLHKKISLVFIALFLCSISFSQILTTIADGGNKKASVSERIGITDVTIHYDRPAVKGREGRIWGQLVHKGFADLQFGSSKAAPWRAGANENTTISFSTDVLFEGVQLNAGTYGLFMAMGDGDATIILSNNSTSWGSFFYNPDEDALRVSVKTEPLQESVERLKFEFTDQTENTARVALLWEKLMIPFTIEVNYVKTQIESFRRELRNEKGFQWQAWVEAVKFCVQHNTNLEEALQWADNAINAVFVGQKNFTTLNAKASILNRMGRNAEADAVMKEALPFATMQELHNYARQLLKDKKTALALEIFKLNAQKNPNQFTTNAGLMRGYSASGDYKNALKSAKAALTMAPDKPNRDAIEKYIKMLEEGKDIN